MVKVKGIAWVGGLSGCAKNPEGLGHESNVVKEICNNIFHGLTTGNVEWYGDASNFTLSNKLCVMEWWGYPYESLPKHFQSDNLVELKMPYSCIKQLWVGSKSFDKLKNIDLSDSQNMIETPDLSGVPNLQQLILEGCSRLNKIPDSVGNLTSLRALNLKGTAIKKIPLSFERLTSLETLDISNCSRLEEIPKNLLSGMKCLEQLYVSGSATRKLRPDPIISLLLPNSLSGLSSLWYLDLSGNKFTRIPDGVGQLPCLLILDLSDCSRLQVLPKLPLELIELRVRNCPSLESQMDMWTTSNEKFKSIDCSGLQSHIDYDGKHFKILHLHPRSPVWRSKDYVSICRSVTFYPDIECGPASLVGSGIPEWFNDKSTNSSFGTIQLHSDLGEDGIDQWRDEMGYAVFIVYEFHEPHTHTHPRKRRKVKVDERKGNSNSTTSDGTNSNFPIFLCHFQLDGVDAAKPLVLCAPVVPSVGPNGFWAFIPAVSIELFFWDKLRGRTSLGTSITRGSLHVEVKECGARVVRYNHDFSELYQVLNTISPRGWDLQSFEDIRYRGSSLRVFGPIIINKSKVVASGSIGSLNCQHLLKKRKRRKIRLIGNWLTCIKGKQKTLTFPSQWIRGKPTKKRRRTAHE
ncbi:hypothetical protein FH972_019877 [Carpinus fangiana]|uniref:Disease resistance R13L4/SHOC-2-like LRR domain-containing protein n=1 Tax=Carpinus fangiana TaxID=176857 RepID=A0A5N6RUQ1_9ROSI|nr:hypothetical protein FH972_019877 [Carpinus fangiana]